MITETDNDYDVSAPGKAAPPVTYKKYVALLNQSNTSAPVPTLLENTMNAELEWSYSQGGEYFLTASDPIFISGKTVVFTGPPATQRFYYVVSILSETVIMLQAVDLDDVQTNGQLINTSFEVRIYP
jgi:hypothetical protein